MSRQHKQKGRLLLVDNFDSFTYNIVDYLCRLGVEVTVYSRTEVLQQSVLTGYCGLVISPGPGNPENIPELKEILERALGKFPVLGICLGHQAIAHYFGARIIQSSPMHGKISMVQAVNDSELLKGIPAAFRVVRYHSLVVSDLPPVLQPLLLSRDDKSLMAFTHRDLPVSGIQFHPEAHLTEFGLSLLKNWLDVCMKYQGIFSPET